MVFLIAANHRTQILIKIAKLFLKFHEMFQGGVGGKASSTGCVTYFKNPLYTKLPKRLKHYHSPYKPNHDSISRRWLRAARNWNSENDALFKKNVENKMLYFYRYPLERS